MSLIPESSFTRVRQEKVFGRSDNDNDNNNIWNQRYILLNRRKLRVLASWNTTSSHRSNSNSG